MRKLLGISVLLLPLMAVGYALFVLRTADVSMRMVFPNYIKASETELATLDRATLAKLASHAIEQNQNLDATWKEAKKYYEAVVWILSGLLVVISSALAFLCFRKRPNTTFNPDVQKSSAD